jgi:hypothetical protein
MCRDERPWYWLPSILSKERLHRVTRQQWRASWICGSACSSSIPNSGPERTVPAVSVCPTLALSAQCPSSVVSSWPCLPKQRCQPHWTILPLSVLVVSCFQPLLSKVLSAINVPFRDIWHKLLRYATSSVGRELALSYSARVRLLHSSRPPNCQTI